MPPFYLTLLLVNALQAIDTLDRRITLFINGSHTPTLDTIMVFVTDRNVWYPFYGVLIGFLIYVFRKRALLLLPLLIASVSLADIITSRIFKPYFGRLRPCHDPGLQHLLHLPDGCGGQFGFLSSHASNSMALAVFVYLALPKGRYTILKVLIICWALLLSYSRLYLGAHYLTDVVGGALLGGLLALIAAIVFQKLDPNKEPAPRP